MKTMRTRIWGILLVLTMLLSLMPVTALAADGDEYDEWTNDTSLPSRGMYKLTTNVTIADKVTVGGWASSRPESPTSTLTLDLNGYTVTATNGQAFFVQTSGGLIIEDSAGTGKITNASESTSSNLIHVNGGQFTLSGGTLENVMERGCALFVNSDSAVTITGGNIVNTVDGGDAVYVNGGTFEMTGGHIDQQSTYSSDAAIYANNSADSISISGGEISSACKGVYAAFTPVNVTGGTFDTDGYAFQTRNLTVEPADGREVSVTSDQAVIYSFSGSANEIHGGSFSAPYISNDYTDEDASTLEISSGKFAGLTAVEQTESNTQITISGGTYTNTDNTALEDVENYIDGDKIFNDETGAVEDLNEENAAASITKGDATTYYKDLMTAITAAESGDTITLMKNATLSNDISIDKNLAIDGDGQYKVGYSEGYNPSDYAITVMPEYEFTLKDVEWNITGTSNYGVDVRYDAALTLDGAKLTISGVSNATISAHTGGASNTNPGKFTLTNGSVIKAADIGGNFSNGGDWMLEGDSNITINGCDSYGLSVHTLKVDGSTVDITGVKYAAVKTNGEGGSIEVVNNGTIEVSESGSLLPFGSNYGRAESVVDLGHGGRGTAGDGSDIPNVPASLTVDETSSIVLTDNENKDGEDTNYVYLTNTAELDNRGEITDVVMQEAEAGSYRVVYMVNGQTYHVVNVESKAEDGVTTITYVEPADPEVDGYRFNGWDYGNDVSVEDGQVTITIGENAPDDCIYTFEADMTRRNSGSAGGDASKPSIRPDTDDDDNDRPSTSTGLPFDDVDTGDWYYEAVEYVYENGLMNGVASDEFSPNATLTRGMMVTILYRLEGEPAVNYALPFDDIDGDEWYAEAVRWAASEGIVNGVSDTEYAPNANITREQLATMLYRYAQYSGMDAVDLRENISGFADAASVSEYAVQALNWAVGEELVNGMGDNTLAPQGNATRAQAAALLMRYVEYVA